MGRVSWERVRTTDTYTFPYHFLYISRKPLPAVMPEELSDGSSTGRRHEMPTGTTQVMETPSHASIILVATPVTEQVAEIIAHIYRTPLISTFHSHMAENGIGTMWQGLFTIFHFSRSDSGHSTKPSDGGRQETTNINPLDKVLVI
jgi:hypothetical protein